MSLESEIIQLRETNAALILTNKALEARILELEEKLKMTSKNSSKPPSSDRFKPNLRAKTEKKRGGQQGHKGSNLPLSENPDEIEYLRPENCTGCGSNLTSVEKGAGGAFGRNGIADGKKNDVGSYDEFVARYAFIYL